MDFSKAFRYNGLLRWSPNGEMFAVVNKTNLVVKDASTLKTVASRSNQDVVDHIEWSCDSEYILCAQYKRCCVQVWAVSNAEKKWSATIDEGLAGLDYARWSPDGRHILTTTEFQLRLTIWSLVDRSVAYIKYPKFSERGVDFSNDGKFLAVAERREFKDYIGLYYTETWELVKTFELESRDLYDLKWSPDDRAICVWDSSLDYKLLVYTPDGKKLTEHVAYENALGIKTVAWSPSSQFLAVGSFDEEVRVLNNITWKVLAQHPHTQKLLPDSRVTVYREVPSDHVPSTPTKHESHDSDTDFDGETSTLGSSDAGGDSSASRRHSDEKMSGHAGASSSSTRTKYILESLPYSIPSVTADPDKPNPRLGVGIAVWSHDDRYLATRNDNMAQTVWIWDMKRLSLAHVLIQRNPVRALRWHPHKLLLSIACANDHIYQWTTDGSTVVRIPIANFTIRGMRWNKAGSCLALLDKAQYCCLFA